MDLALKRAPSKNATTLNAKPHERSGSSAVSSQKSGRFFSHAYFMPSNSSLCHVQKNYGLGSGGGILNP